MNPLTNDDYDLIFESLRNSKKSFLDYDGYPDEAFRHFRIEAVETAVEHLRRLRDEQLGPR